MRGTDAHQSATITLGEHFQKKTKGCRKSLKPAADGVTYFQDGSYPSPKPHWFLWVYFRLRWSLQYAADTLQPVFRARQEKPVREVALMKPSGSQRVKSKPSNGRCHNQ